MKKKFFILLLLIIANFSTNVFARYYEKISNINLSFNIAEPIIIVEKKQDTIIKNINSNSPIQEFYFTIKNYKNIENNKKISEVDFEFDIEIKNSDDTFPIKYELYDCLSNENILLEDNRTEKIDVFKNIEFEGCYKLCVVYENKNSQSTSNSIDIEININQKI